jgi:molybdopterin synthase catalytic subunit
MSRLFQVRKEPLDVAEVLSAVARADAGGIALFVGTVRDHNDGRTVTRLEYEAYVSMADKQMRALGDAIERELPGVTLSALHRIGSLEVGEIAVVCAASAAHREQAFVACRLLIDRIKAEVPIWKREHDSAGTTWVGFQQGRAAPSPNR